MERAEIEKGMFEVTKDTIHQIGGTAVTLDSNFREDLGADSLDEVELVMTAEEHFDIEITDEDAEKCKTVKDAVALVERLLQG